MEERVRATEQEARRRALDEFMQDFRVEERHYFRENKSVTSRQKSMILQERLYFRNLPLSNWVEHEMVVEQEMRRRSAPGEGLLDFQHQGVDGRKQECRLPVARTGRRVCSRPTPQLATASTNGQAA